ncbi:hypothetical protein CR513_11023, partial [Mucuna pruriens]
MMRAIKAILVDPLGPIEMEELRDMKDKEKILKEFLYNSLRLPNALTKDSQEDSSTSESESSSGEAHHEGDILMVCEDQMKMKQKGDEERKEKEKAKKLREKFEKLFGRPSRQSPPFLDCVRLGLSCFGHKGSLDTHLGSPFHFHRFIGRPYGQSFSILVYVCQAHPYPLDTESCFGRIALFGRSSVFRRRGPMDAHMGSPSPS